MKPETICNNIAEANAKFGVHCHGLLILDKGYFRRDSSKDDVVFGYIEDPDESFFMFMHSLIDSLMTFTKVPEGTSIPLDIYLGKGESTFKEYVPKIYK